jgi:hypothetical protein
VEIKKVTKQTQSHFWDGEPLLALCGPGYFKRLEAKGVGKPLIFRAGFVAAAWRGTGR